MQNVYLPVSAGTNFSITVMGYRVNVNAVTAQSNNVVQDYALVISCGNGQDPAAMNVTPEFTGADLQSYWRPANRLSVRYQRGCALDQRVCRGQHASDSATTRFRSGP